MIFLLTWQLAVFARILLGTKDTMYFGTGEKTYNADAVRGGGVWKSVDHGVTWNLLPSTTSFFNVSKIICDTIGDVYVSTIGNSKGIQRSKDGGATWTNITPTGLNTICYRYEIKQYRQNAYCVWIL